MTDQLTRIGRGVPGAYRPKPKNVPKLVLAAAVLAGVTALTAVVIFFDRPPGQSPQAVASAVDNRIECANITHAYNQWWPGRERLDILSYVDPSIAESFLKTLNDDAQAFTDAATGYRDDLSKELALAIIDLHSQLIPLQFQQRIQHTVDEALLKKAQTAWDTAGEKYREFTEVC